MKSGAPSLRNRLSSLSPTERAFVLRAVVTGDWDWSVGAHLEGAPEVRDALASVRSGGRAALAGSLAALADSLTVVLQAGRRVYRGPSDAVSVNFLRALGQLAQDKMPDSREELSDARSASE